MAEAKGNRAQLVRIGVEDLYATKVGSQKYLRNEYGISSSKIYERIIEITK